MIKVWVDAGSLSGSLAVGGQYCLCTLDPLLKKKTIKVHFSKFIFLVCIFSFLIF